MIRTVKELKEYLDKFPDDSYIAAYIFLGRPHPIILTKEGGCFGIDCPSVSPYKGDLLKQLEP